MGEDEPCGGPYFVPKKSFPWISPRKVEQVLNKNGYFIGQAVREINKFGYRECVDRRLKTYKHMDGDDE